MSVCPKCGNKLHALSLGQDCPHCGVNMRFYKFDERFIMDAKMSELSLANVHVKIRNMKTAFIGGKLPKLRIAVMLLPLLSMLIPAANVELKLPFAERAFAVSALGLYTAFTDGTFGLISGISGSEAFGDIYGEVLTVFFATAATAAFAIFCLLFSLLCFLSLKKMPILLCIISSLGAVASAAVAVLSSRLSADAAVYENGAVSASLSFGFIVTIVAFAAVFAVNLIISIKGLHPVYEEGDLERVEIRKKIKLGEITIESLPQPIVETAATRAIDEEIRKEQQRFKDKEAQTV